MLPETDDQRPIEVKPRTLREFAALCLAIFGGLAAMGFHRNGGQVTAGILGLLGLAVGLGLTGLIRPAWIRPVFVGATALTRPIGQVVGLILLAIVFHGVLTPIGFAFRMLGRDPLAVRRRSESTYWIGRGQTQDVRRYLRQYQLPPSRLPATGTSTLTTEAPLGDPVGETMNIRTTGDDDGGGRA